MPTEILGFTQLSLEMIPAIIAPEVKWPEREAECSPQ